MKKDIILISILLFFLILAIWSVLFIVKSQRSPIIQRTLSRQYKPGIFSIEGAVEANINAPFIIRVVVNSNNQSVNAVGLEMTFDPAMLEILNVDTTQSFCQFYPENKFNNSQGTVSIQCGAPHPGFKGEDRLASIRILPKNIGQTKLTITDKSMILVSDGKGTNIFTKPLVHNLTILNNL